jgi:hypothetical protein
LLEFSDNFLTDVWKEAICVADNIEIEAPSSDKFGPSYDAECRAALRPAFEQLVEQAAEAGWNRNRATIELMYLASEAIGTLRQK